MGTSLPSSSRMRTSVDGSGRPMEPEYAVAVTGVQVTEGEVSAHYLLTDESNGRILRVEP